MTKLKIFIALVFIVCFENNISLSWGSSVHKKINRFAIEHLSEETKPFFQLHADWIEQHANEPDDVRDNNEDSTEAQHHFIDIDYYGTYPFEEMPRDFSAAVHKFSFDTITAMGTLPWRIVFVTESLSVAMSKHNSDLILHWSAWLGHYIADAHQPLHTVINYDGQLTEQNGIHWRYESKMMEMFNEQYLFTPSKSEYIAEPLSFAFQIVLESYLLSDSILHSEKKIHEKIISSQMKATKHYNDEYYAQLNEQLQRLTREQIQKATERVACFWYTAWVNAGKPQLQVR